MTLITLAVTNALLIRSLCTLSNADCSMLLRIARAESYCYIKATATNPLSTASGAFQILDGTWKANKCTGNKLDLADNYRCAEKIYQKRGTQPWITSKYLPSGNGWGQEKQCYKFFK